MKNERLLRAMGEIDDDFIAEAAPQNEKVRDMHMKTNKIVPYLRKGAGLAAALALVVCLSGITVLAATGTLQGFFSDILGRNGAVVGASYTQAGDEVTLTVQNALDEISVELTMVYPERVPYREFESFGIKSYKITDAAGNVVKEATAAETAPVVNGKCTLSIPAEDLSPGEYRLSVSELTGSKKADQPLVLSGQWECAFTR